MLTRLAGAFDEVLPEHLKSLGNAQRAKRRADIFEILERGRANAVSLRTLSAAIAGHPARSTLREDIHQLQEWGIEILSSPRAGVWIAADDDEVLDVLEELRASITAIEKRMQLINGGKCALRSCRAELTEKIRNRGGLYCRPEHRYKAAVERGAP
jgi:biotin operon repressor